MTAPANRRRHMNEKVIGDAERDKKAAAAGDGEVTRKSPLGKRLAALRKKHGLQ